MLKKLISIALSAAMLISVVSFNTLALDSAGLDYEIKDGYAEITSYSGGASSLTVPDTLDGYEVQGIAENAFRKSGVKNVVLPDSIKYVGESAFSDCVKLEKINLGGSLEAIGDTAFYNCKSLSSALRFPDSLRTIGESAFENCWDMSYAVIPEGVEEIDYCAFGYYYEKASDDNEYYDYARSDFRILGYADTVAQAYSDKHSIAFYDLSSGISAATSDGMDFFINSDGSAELTAYADTYSTAKIPSKINGFNVTSIGRLAFFGSPVKTVTIPSTVTEIGEWAFEGCDNLKSVNVPPTVNRIGEGAFGYYYDDGFNLPYLDFKICGAPSTAAKNYADKYEFMFEDIYTTFLTLKKSSAKIYVKGSVNISASVKNSSKKTTYKSADEKIAKVTSSGKVTGVKAGKTKITVTNNGVKKTFTVTVKNPKLNRTTVKIKAGKIYQLKITGKVGKAKFSSSNKKVLKVNSTTGRYKGLRKGSAYINVKTNGMKLKCKVSIID